MLLGELECPPELRDALVGVTEVGEVNAEHRRILDMRQGVLFRETVFEDSEGRRTRIETVRFASAADEHLCCLQARITPDFRLSETTSAGTAPNAAKARV